jgi:hypothetical protein
MKIHNFEQGTKEWYAARLGIPTASEFSKIITPGGVASKSADDYANKLIAEIMSGESAETFDGNKWTQRGKELEPDAILYYEQLRNVTVQKVGFVTDDARTMGCSPDALVGDDGMLEIKILSPQNHVAQMLKPSVDREHYPQIMGQLFVAKRKWVDIMAYHPQMQAVIVRVERDDKFFFELTRLMAQFNKMLAEKMKTLNITKE